MNLLVSTLIITLSWTSVQCDNQRDKLFFLQKSAGLNNETLLVVAWMESKHDIVPGCEIFTDEELIKKVLLSSGDSYIRTLSEDEMQNLLGDCKEFTLRRRRRDSEDGMETRLPVEYIDDEPKEFRENSNGRRTPQNARRQEDDGRRAPQNAREQNGNRQRSPQNVRRQNGDSQREPQTARRQTGNSQREPQNVRRQNGDSQREPQNVRRQNGYGRIPQANRQVPGITTTWSTNSIEMAKMTPVTASFMNNTTTGTSTNAEAVYDTTTETPTTVQGYNGINIIFPGTKWCGAGDRAKSYTDLGSAEDTDKCCRAHDICNDTLAPGETRNNVTNTSPFTKLSCECDEEFYDCLDSVNSVSSNTVGNMYFNILRRECYRKDYPKTKECKKYRSFLKITCSEYERDTNAPKVYQWVPAKRYRKIIPVLGALTTNQK